MVRTVRPIPAIPLTLHRSLAKTALLFAGSALFVAGGILMVRNGNPAGYFCGGFFALCLLVLGIQFHPKASCVHLAPEGFTVRSLFCAHTVQWNCVEKFVIGRFLLKGMVVWNFVPDYPSRGRAGRLTKALSGYDGGLPGIYAMKAQDLADLLNSFVRRGENDEIQSSV